MAEGQSTAGLTLLCDVAVPHLQDADGCKDPRQKGEYCMLLKTSFVPSSSSPEKLPKHTRPWPTRRITVLRRLRAGRNHRSHVSILQAVTIAMDLKKKLVDDNKLNVLQVSY